jgi:hypothetical protein
MSFSTDLGWLNIQELDPRVDKLVTVAIRAMARGEGHAYSPHMLYSDMKPYLAALIGTRAVDRNAGQRRLPAYPVAVRRGL